MVDEWMGMGWVWVCEEMSHACIHAHACTRTCTCMHMHVKHAKHDKHGCLHVGGHLQFLYMYKCVCVHVRTCACVGGHPHALRCPPPTCPLPRAAGSPKYQNSISPELIKIILFCLKILYLWTFLNSYRLLLITLDTPHPPAPPPWAKETQIGRITITLERIEIIQFCLKICDPWAFLHTYRLGLMCRWGCPISNGTFMFLMQRSAPVTLK